MLPECFLESLSQGQTVVSPVWHAESPACRLLAKVVFVAVLCLGDVWKAAPQLHGCVYLKSVSVAALGGTQAGALGAYFGAARGFLLLPLLLFPLALRGPSLHPQVVDPVGLWMGDFAEGHFVDGRVFWVYQQEEQRGQAERPGADWQPELEGTEQTQGCTWVPLFGLFACLPVAKFLCLGSWEGLCSPWRHSGYHVWVQLSTQRSVVHLGCVGLHKASDTADLSPVRGGASVLVLNGTWHQRWSNWIRLQSSDDCNESQDTQLTRRLLNSLIKETNSTLSAL